MTGSVCLCLYYFHQTGTCERGHSVQNSKGNYTSREAVEELLRQTRQASGADGQAAASLAKTKRPLGKRIRTILYALIVLALLGMLANVWMDRLNGRVPDLFGYQMYSVETGSMIPSLPIGSTIIVRTLAPDEGLAVGDIITYTHGKAVITHRVTELVVDETGLVRYQTQGDNPDNSADPWLVDRENVRGIVVWQFSMPWSGR